MHINDSLPLSCLCKGENFFPMRVSEARRSLRQGLPFSPLPTPILW